MLKPLTFEGRFESGFNELTEGKTCALVAVWSETAWGLGIAVANEDGYYPVPLHWCHSDDHDAMYAHADQLNKELFGHDATAAAKIICTTMRGSRSIAPRSA